MIYAGSNFTLRCVIILSTEVDTVEPIEVSVNWTGPLNFGIVASDVQQSSENILQYTSELLLYSVRSGHAGSYTCEAQVAVINSAFFIPSSPRSNTTEINISMYHIFYYRCDHMMCVCLYVVSAPSAPDIESLLPLNSTSVQIVGMKGSEIDVVENFTVEYMYRGPCDCSDQILELCQWRNVSEITDNEFKITISNLQEHSNYIFKVVANNQAGPSPPIEMIEMTLSAGK